MLQKRHNSTITLLILLALVGGAKPAKILAQSDAAEERITQTNINLEDSGQVNPEFESSGGVNFEAEGSGEPDFKLRDSGKINSEFEDSGVLDPNAAGSGEVNPEIEDSGEPISPNSQLNRAEAAPSLAQLAEPEAGDVIVEDENNNRGLWWTLLLLLPLIALGLYIFSRGKKSDREPAIGNIPNPNNPSGGLGIPTGTNRDNLYARGSNLSGNLDNVAGKIGTASLGATALAEGTAATSNLAGEKRIEGDRSELETESEAVVEIPSSPVSEFTPREARLQTTEQPTEIQTNLDDDDNSAFALRENVSPGEDTREPIVEEQSSSVETATETLLENDTSDVSSDNLEQPTATTEIEEQVVGEIEPQELNASEFRGDYVLIEETSDEPILEQPDTAIDENTIVDDSDLPQSSFDDSAVLEGEVVAPVGDRVVQTPELEELDDRDTIVEDSQAIAEEDLKTTPNSLDTTLDDLTFEDTSQADISLEEITFDDRETSTNAGLDYINLDEIDSSADINLDDLTFEDTSQADISLEEITFDDRETSTSAGLDYISLDEIDSSADINLDDLTFDDVETSADASNLDEISLDDLTFDNGGTETAADASNLDEISLDETNNSTDVSLQNIDTPTRERDISLDHPTTDLLSSRTAKITDLDDESDDMDNITEWLDSLETSEQNTDNISEWLEQLKVDDDDVEEESNNQEVVSLEGETDDISFQFLEDLLEEDANPNRQDR
ncbi:hypothetical protein IQ255_25060 [Pleurocapsales cyanobacterium LEGE 10410]|nr:hypothetical protein [Pleurocapsales cyanobacterium LEGE 10410]